MRISAGSELLPAIRSIGYNVEPCVVNKDTMVVAIPIDAGESVRTVGDVSMWEQLSLAAFLQKYWADNQVSCTVTFDPATEGNQIKHALSYFQYSLKGISFLPRLEKGAYAQMPYEAISEEQYKAAAAQLNTEITIQGGANLKANAMNNVPDKFCDSAGCSLSSGGSVNEGP